MFGTDEISRSLFAEVLSITEFLHGTYMLSKQGIVEQDCSYVCS